MDRDTATEFTEALDQTASGLGQATTGWWRQVAAGVRLKVAEELDRPRDEWTAEHRDAFGNMLLRAPERKEAVLELTAPVENGGEGLNNSEAADVLGVSERTVRNDRSEKSEATAPKPTLELGMEPDDSEKSEAEPEAKPKLATFNRVNDNIGWAKWSWNPVTGCLHNCPYCYARDIANRFYPEKFEPTFHPERLLAPQNTKLPAAAASGDAPEWGRVFTCSMADLFGKWVPQEWVDAVFEQIVTASQWEFLCLTKFPQRLAETEWPDNVWAGTTVDKQHRVDLAQRSFAGVKAGVRWLSCEPLLEPLRFDSLEMFDWVVIGACTSSSGAPAFAPPWDWVVDLYQQARDAGCRVFLKHNLREQEPGIEMVREWPR